MTDAELFQIQTTAASVPEDAVDPSCIVHLTPVNDCGELGAPKVYGPVNLTVARILKREIKKRDMPVWIEVV